MGGMCLVLKSYVRGIQLKSLNCFSVLATYPECVYICSYYQPLVCSEWTRTPRLAVMAMVCLFEFATIIRLLVGASVKVRVRICHRIVWSIFDYILQPLLLSAALNNNDPNRRCFATVVTVYNAVSVYSNVDIYCVVTQIPHKATFYKLTHLKIDIHPDSCLYDNKVQKTLILDQDTKSHYQVVWGCNCLQIKIILL